MAIPLHPNATPAHTIVSDAGERRNARSAYGSRLTSPNPSSTSRIVSRSEVWVVVLRGGAHSPAPITPITIAAIARCSLRPACSCSIRWPANTSTISPAARAGCTTTSGASNSATTCSGQPRIDSPVPSIHRPRRISPHTSARRRWSSSGASLASIACRAIPRL